MKRRIVAIAFLVFVCGCRGTAAPLARPRILGSLSCELTIPSAGWSLENSAPHSIDLTRSVRLASRDYVVRCGLRQTRNEGLPELAVVQAVYTAGETLLLHCTTYRCIRPGFVSESRGGSTGRRIMPGEFEEGEEKSRRQFLELEISRVGLEGKLVLWTGGTAESIPLPFLTKPPRLVSSSTEETLRAHQEP